MKPSTRRTAAIGIGLDVRLERVRRNEVRLAGLGLPLAMTGRERPVKSARLPHSLVEVFEHQGIGALNGVADAAIIGDPARSQSTFGFGGNSSRARARGRRRDRRAAACFLSRISGWRDRGLYPLA